MDHELKEWKSRFILIWTGQAFLLFGSALVILANLGAPPLAALLLLLIDV